MMATLTDYQFWLGLAEIIGINIVLSGDNAVVIALACRSLPPLQQKRAIFFGSAGAIALRILLTGFAAVLLTRPYLKLAGSALLLWIAVKLLIPDDEAGSVDGRSGLMAAIKTIIVADLVMSLDNVLGVAAAAHGNLVLLALGLLISMPLIIYGSTVILKLMGRFPVLITLGAALLGYVAGEMGTTDPVVSGWITATWPPLFAIVPLACAALVVLAGQLLARPRPVQELSLDESAPPVDPDREPDNHDGGPR